MAADNKPMSGEKAMRASAPVIGVIFLALGIFKFFAGEGWVVWFILAFLFGGFSIFTRNRSGADK